MRTITSWHDIFIPAAFTKKYDKLYISKMRNFIFLILAFFFNSLLVGIYEVGRNHPIIITLLLSGALFAVICYTIFLKTARVELAANLVLAYVAIELSVDAFIAGFLDAPGLIWYGTAAIGTISLTGTRTSMFWCGYFILITLVSFYMQTHGAEVIYHIQQDDLAFIKMLCSIGSIVIIGGLTIKYERERRRLYTELSSKNDEVMNLIRVLSHDLANPLAVIHTSNQLLPAGVHPMVDKTKDRTARSIKNMMNIIDHVREARAVYDGKKEMHLDIVDLNEILKNSIDLFEDKLKFKSLTVDLKLSENPATIFVDKKAIEASVVNNLISNAIKFSDLNSTIEISTHITDKCVSLRIRDFGIGIPQELLERLFDSHVSTSRQGTQGEVGTGYGMPILKAYLDKFHAQIRIHSFTHDNGKQKRGTEFVIQFHREKIELKLVS